VAGGQGQRISFQWQRGVVPLADSAGTAALGLPGVQHVQKFRGKRKLDILQRTSQYFASQMTNLDWVKHDAGVHRLFPAEADVADDAGHTPITAYALKRPSGEWSLMLITKDPSKTHAVKIEFGDSNGKTAARFSGSVTMVTFGAEQCVEHPEGPKSHAESGRSTDDVEDKGKTTAD
jgi:hypothetical protein